MVWIFLFFPGTKSFEVINFSTPKTTPSLHLSPTEVAPFSTALTAYSTWKFLPSGEKTLLDKSYPVPIEVIEAALIYVCVLWLIWNYLWVELTGWSHLVQFKHMNLLQTFDIIIYKYVMLLFLPPSWSDSQLRTVYIFFFFFNLVRAGQVSANIVRHACKSTGIQLKALERIEPLNRKPNSKALCRIITQN